MALKSFEQQKKKYNMYNKEIQDSIKISSPKLNKKIKHEMRSYLLPTISTKRFQSNLNSKERNHTIKLNKPMKFSLDKKPLNNNASELLNYKPSEKMLHRISVKNRQQRRINNTLSENTRTVHGRDHSILSQKEMILLEKLAIRKHHKNKSNMSNLVLY